MDLFAVHSDFHVRLDADPFSLELRTPTFLYITQPQLLPSPPPRPLSPYRTTSEFPTEYFQDAQNQLSYTRHCQSYRMTYRPSPPPPVPHPSVTIVLAHIYAQSRSSRTRITICGRPRVRDVVRQLLGHTPENRCVVSIKKRGAWQDVGFEVKIGGSEPEVEIKILTEAEDRRPRVERRWFEKDGSRERIVMERWN